MGLLRSSLIISLLVIIILIISTISARQTTFKQKHDVNERIDCYPEAQSPFSNFSEESCLARNCLYDNQANSNSIQCYLSPHYGYIVQNTPEKTSNGIRLKLKRNSAVNSMFEQPIENVLLDVQYYTNNIIRFKLTDADQQRYEVGREKLMIEKKFEMSFRSQFH